MASRFKRTVSISKDIENAQVFARTVMSCLRRDPEWISYHAESLASFTESKQTDISQLELVATEQRAFQLMRDGSFEKAISQLERYCEATPGIDPNNKGWLLQFAACIANKSGHFEKAQQLQRQAFALNRNLLRPQTPPSYIPLLVPSHQAEAIVERIEQYHYRRGYMAAFDGIVSQLVSTASSNQFEQALAELGTVLGFRTQRPDNEYRIGPDVLWLLNDSAGMIMEAKSRKAPDNPLTKEEHGQLLDAEQWFKKEYPNFTCTRVSVHPNATARKITAEASNVLTLDKLQKLVSEVRDLLETLTSSLAPRNDLILQCEQLLDKSNLKPQKLISHYLITFEAKRQ